MSYNKLKIGEFSRLCRVTVRTLRHYEEIGLLVPEIVDMETGYRYYSVHQMQKMNAIRNLKEMGFSLKEIMELCPDISKVTVGRGNAHSFGVVAGEENFGYGDGTGAA